MNKEACVLQKLSEVTEGSVCTLVKWGNIPATEIRRLRDLGVMTRMPVTVSQVTNSGPIVIAVNDARVAVAHHIADEIMVLPKIVESGE